MIHPFEQHILSTIERLNLLRRSSPVLVGLSGGADSVALLSVLTSLGFDTVAAHCNFRLRGDESMRDMRHAEAVAKRLGVNIYVKEFDVGRRIKSTGESVEMACRALRYDWFDSLLDRESAQAVAVAHHREDNVETFFLNLLRSTGLSGLTGMAWRRDSVVRPMLDVSRAEIEQYLKDKGLEYVTDSSNNSDRYRRNRLRNTVLPVLEESFPGAADSILKVMSNLEDSRLMVDDGVGAWLDRVGATESRIDVTGLITVAGRRRARIVLSEWLRPRGFNATMTDDIVEAAVNGRSGRRFDAQAYRAELDRGILSIISNRPGRSVDSININLHRDILTPINIEVTISNIATFKPERDEMTAYFDETVFDGAPIFELRHYKTGDRIAPFGMEGEKLVSKLMKDARFSAAQKRETWILTRNSEILWVVGLRSSRRWSLTPATRRYVRLTYRP